jgi:hypothetical protein
MPRYLECFPNKSGYVLSSIEGRVAVGKFFINHGKLNAGT